MKKRSKTKSLPPPQSAPRPPWIPNDRDLDRIPDEVRLAVDQIVQPVYERFVVESSDPLEKSLGVTVTHLLWLEILQQANHKHKYTELTALLGTETEMDHHREIDQHLRIIESKVRVGYLLTHIRELRHRWNQALPDAIDVSATPQIPQDSTPTPQRNPKSPPLGSP